MRWKDISSYSQGEVRGVDPKMIEAIAGPFKIVVTRHIHYPGKWMLRCDGIFDLRELRSSGLAEAKLEAIGLVRQVLDRGLKALGPAAA